MKYIASVIQLVRVRWGLTSNPELVNLFTLLVLIPKPVNLFTLLNWLLGSKLLDVTMILRTDSHPAEPITPTQLPLRHFTSLPGKMGH